jgi:hypothetical protein
MPVLVGIDEAGYGPLLGPLVVSSVAFSLPQDLVKSDLWRVLKPAVGKRKTKLGGRLLITDSKKAYSRSTGIEHLRRTVLANILCLDKNTPPITTAGRFLDVLCSNCAERLLEYPWYKGLCDKNLNANLKEIRIASFALNNELSKNSMKLLNMSSRCLDVGHYNKMVSAVKNKASVLFTTVASLIMDAFNAYGSLDSQPLQIIVDRQGGRVNYRTLLQRMFEHMDLAVIRQDNKVSSYELTDAARKMRIHFVTAADKKYLPVSLASMTSKFLREILVESINRYFLDKCRDLKPTAGYWKDGQRFIRDLDQNLGSSLYDSEKLIRCR